MSSHKKTIAKKMKNQVGPKKKEKLSSFAKSIGLAKGRYFCTRCENQAHNVDFEGKCSSCSN